MMPEIYECMTHQKKICGTKMRVFLVIEEVHMSLNNQEKPKEVEEEREDNVYLVLA
jgi:hypothetical protein